MGEAMVPGAGVDLAVRTGGDPEGVPVVLIHGFPDTSVVWDPVRALLEDRFHVISYDVRGMGASSDPGHDGYGLPLLVADLEAVLDATVGHRPVHLVGHDWGSIQGWEAVLTPRLMPRFASYTSISAPPIDHLGLRARQDLRAGLAGLRSSGRQLLRSWYVYLFHLPGIPRVASVLADRRPDQVRRWWAATSARLEGTEPGEGWPAPTFARDLARGMGLYRANVLPRLRHPVARRTSVPVQLVVAEHDHYVPPTSLVGLEDWAGQSWWREVPYGHWVVRSHPEVVADAVTELVDHLEGGPQAPGLAAARRRPA